MRCRLWIALFFFAQISAIFAEGEPDDAAESTEITDAAAPAIPKPAEVPPKETLGDTKPPPVSEEKSKPVDTAPAPVPAPEPTQKSPEKETPSVFSEIHLIAGGGLSLNQSFSSIIGLGWGGLVFTRFEYDKFSVALSAETGVYNSKASQLESSQHTINFEKGQTVGYANIGIAGGYRIFEWQGFAFDLGLGGGYARLSASSAAISRNFFVQVLPEVWYTPWPGLRIAFRTVLYYTFINEPEIDGKKYPLLSVENVIDARIQLLAAYAIF